MNYHLTPREKQIVALICEGHNTESIGNQLGITLSTAQKHVRNVMEKTGCHSRLEIAISFLKKKNESERRRLNTKGLTAEEIAKLKQFCAFLG